MPRWKKKPWIRFSKKVKAVQLSTVGSNYHIILRQATVTTSVQKQFFYEGHTVNGLNGSVTGFNDVSQIFDRAVAQAIIQQKDSGKLIISGWMAETQVINAGASTAYLDMYYWRTKRLLSTVLNTFSSLWANQLADLTPTFPLGGSALTNVSYGVTPFQGVSKNFTIWKKVRTKLDPGEVTQIEQRSGRNYFRSWGFDEEYTAAPRCTEGIFMVFYGTPSATNSIADAVTLRFSTNVNYTWKAVQGATNHGGTNTA